MSVTFRKLTVQEAATTDFSSPVASASSDAKVQIAELVEAFGQLSVGDAVSVDMNGTGTTARAMKRRVKEAAKQSNLAVTFSKVDTSADFPDQLVFRLRKVQARKAKVATK